MKNVTWRRVAMILSVVVIGLIAFGAGVTIGASEAADFMINQVVKVMGFEDISIDISRVELIEYYLKLKGGA